MANVQRKTPLRKCLGCGELIGKKGLMRVVKTKEGEISLDPTGKKSGRGAYICKDIECFKKARTGRGFERALKCRIPDEIYDFMESEISKLKW